MILIIGKERLEVELAAPRAGWKDKMESSLKVAAEGVAERLAQFGGDREGSLFTCRRNGQSLR